METAAFPESHEGFPPSPTCLFQEWGSCHPSKGLRVCLVRGPRSAEATRKPAPPSGVPPRPPLRPPLLPGKALTWWAWTSSQPGLTPFSGPSPGSTHSRRTCLRVPAPRSHWCPPVPAAHNPEVPGAQARGLSGIMESRSACFGPIPPSLVAWLWGRGVFCPEPGACTWPGQRWGHRAVSRRGPVAEGGASPTAVGPGSRGDAGGLLIRSAVCLPS